MSGLTGAGAQQLNQRWKQYPHTNDPPVQRIPLTHARQFFAVDASGSTAGAIIGAEHDAVENLSFEHTNDQATTWGSYCQTPSRTFSDITWSGNLGGTNPTSILTHPPALDAIVHSDIWYLLTDGQVGGQEVWRLSSLAAEKGILDIPVVFLITGWTRGSPGSANVSVGVTFFANARDVLCLFKDVTSGVVYTLAGKGCFAPLQPDLDTPLSDQTWAQLKSFADEQELLAKCAEFGIMVTTAETRPDQTAGIDLGSEWDRAHGDHVTVDAGVLLSAGMLDDLDIRMLLADEAFNNLAMALKTRGSIAELRSFLLQQKVEQVAVRLEDVAGAAVILSRLSGPDLGRHEKELLQAQLRDAHAKNRHHYQNAIKDMAESSETSTARSRNRLVDRALQRLSEVESAGYTADILSRPSNRAMRAQRVEPYPHEYELSVVDLDLDAPSAFRSNCSICLGENEIMSIALKKCDNGEANTGDFALNFPLAAGYFENNRNMISAQCICFQCAMVGRPGTSIYGEEIVAVLPALQYTGLNKTYMDRQLYIAITGGLRTGTAGIAQLFMTVLDRTMHTKQWAGAGVQPGGHQDPEVKQRQALLDWFLTNILRHMQCRDTFNEQGNWSTYRRALQWAAGDFCVQRLTSWAIQYPTAGFMQLLRFGQKTRAFDEQDIRDLRATKVLHSITSLYLAKLYTSCKSSSKWKQPYLALIYTDFHADLVPKDLGANSSLLNSVPIFWAKLAGLLSLEPELLAQWVPTDQELIMRRVQVLLFWLVYHQKGHTTAKTLFAKLSEDQELAYAVLHTRADLPTNPASEILRSIFRNHEIGALEEFEEEKVQMKEIHMNGLCPFRTPFGPSVMHCGFAECPVSFLDGSGIDPDDVEQELTVQMVERLRRNRARHLTEVFGVEESFGRSQTVSGLPEPTISPSPPNSSHTNIHISIARTWGKLDDAQRRSVVNGGAYLDLFIRAVVEEVCKHGRGDIFQGDLDDTARRLLPSFWEVLQLAWREIESAGDHFAALKLDFAKDSKLDRKVKWERKVWGSQR
ncbi:hypothetical protein K490DRAFT_64933 [Saccharata proteae CBS 121410]|uniref:Uncharacterized protein n=1 Tax=Saccharata proteae CBS 121410 TaxID=1314787 RepID=A0A9P4HXG5_9PEZI|nr:hypothetical protein K490DRAFT_64933 [Saccharata proteae CBS 121410]